MRCLRPAPPFKYGCSGSTQMDSFTPLSNHLWPICLHCCHQRKDSSSSDVSGQHSLDLMS